MHMQTKVFSYNRTDKCTEVHRKYQQHCNMNFVFIPMVCDISLSLLDKLLWAIPNRLVFIFPFFLLSNRTLFSKWFGLGERKTQHNTIQSNRPIWCADGSLLSFWSLLLFHSFQSIIWKKFSPSLQLFFTVLFSPFYLTLFVHFSIARFSLSLSNKVSSSHDTLEPLFSFLHCQLLSDANYFPCSRYGIK